MPNIKELNGRQVEPKFAEFLNLVQMRKPSWEFVNASKSTDECKSVMVELDSLTIGILDFRKEGGRYNPNLGYSPSSFIITSKNIQKQRGSKNSIETSDIAKAVHTAVKYVAPPTMEQLYDEMHHEVYSDVSDLPYKANKHRISDVVSFTTRDMNMFLAEWAMEGAQATRDFPAFVRVDNENLVKAYEAKLAVDNVMNAFDGRSGYMLSRLDDDSVLMAPVLPVNSTPVVTRYRTFEDIPEDVRGKYAMLKIVEPFQVFADVGAKLANEYYYVIA